MNFTVRQSACFIALLAVFIFCSDIVGAQAQSVPSAGAAAPSAGSSSSTSKGLAKVLAGAKSYRAGKMAPAIATLTQALSSGGLSSKDLAKALYYRGLAFRRSRKPAEAIADLTSAMWLKGGLSDAERQEAIKNRAAAYKEAGIRDPGLVVARSSGAPKAAAPAADSGWQVATKSSQAAKAAPQVTSGAGSSPTPGINPGISSGPGTLQVAPTGGSSSTSTTSSSSGSPSTGLGSETIASVGSFFSNMFGGTSSTGSGASATGGNTVTSTGTIAPSPGTSSTGSSSGTVSAVSGWNSQTQISTPAATAKPKPKPKPTVVARATPPAVKPASGRYRIRVAAVRSQEEASKVVSIFQTKYASALGGRAPEIAPESVGNMGTFYNVQFGPFAQAKDYKPLCEAARLNGYDCLVIKK